MHSALAKLQCIGIKLPIIRDNLYIEENVRNIHDLTSVSGSREKYFNNVLQWKWIQKEKYCT